MSSKQPIRILQSVGAMNHGGIEHFVMNVYRHIDRSKVQFDFLQRVKTPCVFDEEIMELGGRIFRFQSPDKHPFSSAIFYRGLFKEHPEIKGVHEHRSTLSGFMGCLRAARAAGRTMRIVHSHNSNLMKRYGDIGNIVERYTDGFNKQVIDSIATDYFACSKAAADWLYAANPRIRGLVQVIPNGIDTDRFRFNGKERAHLRAQMGISEDSIVIGHVGRLTEVKNHRFLLEILSSCCEEDIYLLLLGTGELEHQIRSRAEVLGIADKVFMMGPRDDIWRYYSAMDVFCMPSLYEGMPVAAIEAQASGLPVVLSDTVSRDTNLGGDVTFLSLRDNARVWAELLKSKALISADRGAGAEAVNKAGYDISVTADWLQAYYLEGAHKHRDAE